MKEQPIHESMDLQEYWRIVARRRWVIYLSVLTFGLIALVSSFLTTPLFKATATLQIERQQPDVLNIRGVSRPDFWAAFDHYYQTQYAIIASKPVALLAVDELKLTSHKAFAPDPDAKPGLRARLRSLIPRKSRSPVERSAEELAADRLLARLEVLPVKFSYLVDIAWVDSDPVFAAKVTNAIADAYARFSMTSHFNTTDQAHDFLEEQTVELKDEIAVLEDSLQTYAASKNIISMDEASNLTLQALQDISEQLTIAETALARAEAAREARSGADPNSIEAVMTSELIGRLRADYAIAEAQYSEKSRIFGESWPGLQTLQARLEQSRIRLDVEIQRIAGQVRAASESEYRRASGEVDQLTELQSRHAEDAQALRVNAVEYESLYADVKKRRETLDALMRRQNEMALSTRLQETEGTPSNIKVVEAALPPTAPFRPRTSVNLMVGLMLGLTLGLALAFFLDHVDNTISTAAELEALTSVPVLSLIPSHGGSETALARVRRRSSPLATGSIDLIAHVDSRTQAAEAYRSLRTSILLSNPGRPPRRIVLTSAIPGEGKSATALNLSIVLAQLGRRVVLIDTDLRRPRLHLAFQLSDRIGASTYLSGLERDASQLVQPTGIEHLYFIPSGPIPPNPSELLNSPIFTRLGNELLEQGFDHIVYDSPPVLSVSDPVIVAAAADTCIMVVRAGRTPRQSVRTAVERLGQSGGGPLGVVLNHFDVQVGYGRYEYDARYRPGGDDEDVNPTTNEATAGSSAKKVSGRV